MNKFDDCEFCSLQHHVEAILPEYLQISGTEMLLENLIYDGKYFYVKPDISPVIRGHLLIIPKEHYFSILSLPHEKIEELGVIKQEIVNFYASKNKNCLFFEHGCCGEVESGSSCIHHAHLHVIPIDIDEGRNILQETIRKISIPQDVSTIENCTYLYLEISNMKPMYWKDTVTHSQFFRILISETIGDVQRSRWQNCITNQDERLKSIEWLKEFEDMKL